jgi:hypothetical protein
MVLREINMKNNNNKIIKECDVCGKPVAVDDLSSGCCDYCGWKQTSLDRPDEIHWSYNFVSFNKARELVKQGKLVRPDFEDFLKCMRVYSELEFYYKGKHFGLLLVNGVYHFYEWNVMDKGYQKYVSIEEFAERANINGALLKDIWASVEKVSTAS